jgi:hypothetical protein
VDKRFEQADKLSKHTYYHYKEADDTGDANFFFMLGI